MKEKEKGRKEGRRGRKRRKKGGRGESQTGIVTTHVIPALGRLKQKDGEFGANLGYIVRPY
jgi:hypothetical protein